MTRKLDEYGFLEFDDKKVVGTAKIELPLTEDDIENIMTTGLEGGIGYWARLENVGELWKGKPKGVSSSQWATDLLLKGEEVLFSDAELEEGDDEYLFPALTLEKLINGFAQNYKERPHDNDIENGDVTTADCIIQYAIFGKLIYG